MLKKISIILILVLMLLSLVVWFCRNNIKIFFSNTTKKYEIVEKTDDEFSQSQVNTEDQNEKKEENNIVAEGDIKMAHKTEDGRILYYNKNNFLETDFEGQYKKNISSYPFKNLKTIRCSKSGKICLVWADKFYVYNPTTKKKNELDDKIVDVDFNSQEDGLVFLLKEDYGYQLSHSGLLGENQVKLNKIQQAENFKIAVSPKENRLIYFPRKVNEEDSGIFLTELIGNKSPEKIVDKDIIDADWSPSGDKILFSFYDHSVSPKRVQLGFYDLNQKKYFTIGIPTIVQKCAWEEDSSFLYCSALTSSSLQQFVLDDWYSRKFISNDVFWKIDLSTSKKERIFSDFGQDLEIDSFNLFVSDKYLFFVDKLSGSLFKEEK